MGRGGGLRERCLDDGVVACEGLQSQKTDRSGSQWKFPSTRTVNGAPNDKSCSVLEPRNVRQR